MTIESTYRIVQSRSFYLKNNVYFSNALIKIKIEKSEWRNFYADINIEYITIKVKTVGYIQLTVS